MFVSALATTIGILATFVVTSSFNVHPQTLLPSLQRSRSSRFVQTRLAPLRLTLSPDDTSLAAFIVSFSVSHIGMSAAREVLIDGCGTTAERMGVVGRPDWKISEKYFWLGDEAGNQIWPDSGTAGRQLYRLGYTAVSFFTLGGAFGSYLTGRAASPEIFMPAETALNNPYWLACFTVAAMAGGVSIASLTNPSPLSLVPSFVAGDDDAPLNIQRDDDRKLNAYGLTRITRHPLILPVVPWGLATTYLAGGRIADALFFSGLAVYAVCGCYAQDLRAANSEQVGTVLQSGKLNGFYDDTSFVPFGALAAGRQPWNDCLDELPYSAFVFGSLAASGIEFAGLRALGAL